MEVNLSTNTTLKEIMVSIITSIDLISFLLKNHHRRVAIIAYHLGVECNLDNRSLSNLVMAASLHDIGALSVKERDQLIEMDINDPYPHALLGGNMLESFSYLKDVSVIIKNHHIRWEDSNHSNAPIESYILHLADRIEILIDKDKWILNQVSDIKSKILEYEGVLFAPFCIEAFLNRVDIESFWLDIDSISMDELLNRVIFTDEINMDIELLEELAYTFSRIIDFRSKFTFSHSSGVGIIAHEIAKLCNLDDDICREMKIAGFLHDIGKIGVPTELIDKPSKLSDFEFNMMKAHPYYTNRILSNIKGFDRICKWSSLHHERRDGTGYPNHITNKEFNLEIEILACADLIAALSEDRPYRKGMDDESIIELLNKGDDQILNTTVLEVVNDNFEHLTELRKNVKNKEYGIYKSFVTK